MWPAEVWKACVLHFRAYFNSNHHLVFMYCTATVCTVAIRQFAYLQLSGTIERGLNPKICVLAADLHCSAVLRRFSTCTCVVHVQALLAAPTTSLASTVAFLIVRTGATGWLLHSTQASRWCLRSGAGFKPPHSQLNCCKLLIDELLAASGRAQRAGQPGLVAHWDQL
jgi:hypothetical protein